MLSGDGADRPRRRRGVAAHRRPARRVVGPRPARLLHRVRAVTDAVLVEASTAGPGWREDVVRLDGPLRPARHQPALNTPHREEPHDHDSAAPSSHCPRHRPTLLGARPAWISRTRGRWRRRRRAKAAAHQPRPPQLARRHGRPPDQAGHTTYQLAEDPGIGVLWTYAEPGDGVLTRVGGGTYDAGDRTRTARAPSTPTTSSRAAVVYMRHWAATG